MKVQAFFLGSFGFLATVGVPNMASASSPNSTGEVQLRARDQKNNELFRSINNEIRCPDVLSRAVKHRAEWSSQGTEMIRTLEKSATRLHETAFVAWNNRPPGYAGGTMPDGVAIATGDFPEGAGFFRIVRTWISRPSKWGDGKATTSPKQRHINFVLKKVGGLSKSKILGTYTTVGDIFVLACVMRVGGDKFFLERELGGVLRSRDDMYTGIMAVEGEDLDPAADYVLSVSAYPETPNSKLNPWIFGSTTSTGNLWLQLEIKHNGK